MKMNVSIHFFLFLLLVGLRTTTLDAFCFNNFSVIRFNSLESNKCYHYQQQQYQQQQQQQLRYHHQKQPSYHHCTSGNRVHSLTRLNVANNVKPQDDVTLSFAERSRIYRRDVFNYDLWVQHRRTNRFWGSLWDGIKSGVVRQLFREAILLSSVATFVCLYNALFVNGFDDFSGVHHATLFSSQYLPLIKMPMTFFTLSSPALSLLLVFKTNTSYRRWDEGRKNWGTMINSCRTILREGAAWIHEANISNDEKQRLMERLEQAVWSFPRSVTRHLSSPQEDQDDYATDCRAKLRPDLAEDLINARHKPTRSLYEVSCAINEFPIDERRRIYMDSATSILCDAMGSSERIFTSPVPRSYTRHTARFLELWLFLMPLALYEPFATTWNHWGMIPTTFVISIFLLGIEELGLQLEEPFGLLPQHAMTANSIGKVLTEAVEFRALDYQRMKEMYGDQMRE